MAEDWEKEWQRKNEERSKENAGTLQSLFKDLREAGVAIVTVEYDGSGDSGDVQDVTLEDAKGNKMGVDFDERCRSATYEALECRHGGWEINEGSFGNVVFDIRNGKVRFEHNERVMEATLHESEDYVDAGDEDKAKKLLDEMINSPKKGKKK
jgi:hypothetical protein